MNTRDKIGLWADDKKSEITWSSIPFWQKKVIEFGLSILKPRCQHRKCHAEGEPCYLPPDWDENGEPLDEEIEWICFEHMHIMGFCWGYRQFGAGTEDFDFSSNGLCSNCRDNPDFGWHDEDEYSDLDYENDWYLYYDQ